MLKLTADIFCPEPKKILKKRNNLIDFDEKRWHQCVSACKLKRGGRIKWLLTKEEFKNLCSLECHYCNGFFGKTKYGSGLDRIDNDKHYTTDNVLPCCYTCNRTRSNIFTVEETKIMIQAVIEFKKKNSNGR